MPHPDPACCPAAIHFSAAVVYKIKAVCDVVGMLKSDIKSKTELVVFQRDYAIPRAIGQSAVSSVMLPWQFLFWPGCAGGQDCSFCVWLASGSMFAPATTCQQLGAAGYEACACQCCISLNRPSACAMTTF